MGGAIQYNNFGSISFKGNSSTMFSNNTADYYAGAIGIFDCVNMFFGGNSVTTFTDNNSKYGGAIACFYICSISHKGNSHIVFNHNAADYAIFSNIKCAISFNKNSTVVFSDNMADHDGGAVSSDGDISFNGNSYTEFRDNTANNNGGAMFLHANLTFNDNSIVNFTNNNATIGATILSRGESNKIMEIGNPTVIFNDHIVNRCTNTYACLPYHDQYTHRPFGINGDVITIDSNGTVRCSDEQELFISLNRKCDFKYLEDILVNLTSNGLATLSGRVIISSVISLTKLDNVSIIGSKNHSLICINNVGLQLKQCSNITIEGLNWVGCGADTTPVINILNSSDVTLQNCLFQQSQGPAVVIFESSGDVNINHCMFINNTEYSGHGAAVHYTSDTTISQTIFLIFTATLLIMMLQVWFTLMVKLMIQIFHYTILLFIITMVYLFICQVILFISMGKFCLRTM